MEDWGLRIALLLQSYMIISIQPSFPVTFFIARPANTNRSAPVWHGSGATKSMSLKRRCARLLYNKLLGICPFIAYISDDHKGRSHVGQRNDGRLF